MKLVEDLRKILEEYGRAAAAAPNRRPRAAAEHRKIYEAIVRRDTEGAAVAMANHLEAAARPFATLERDVSIPRKQPA